MCSTPLTSSGTAMGIEEQSQLRDARRADLEIQVRVNRFPMPNSRGDFVHGRILQQILQLAGISPDTTTGVLTPSRPSSGWGERGTDAAFRPLGESPGLLPGGRQVARARQLTSQAVPTEGFEDVQRKCASALVALALAGGMALGAPTVAGAEVKASAASKRGDVRALQRKVGVAADGVFGPATERALKRWQRRHGLVADGIAGPQTRSAMGLGSGPILKRRHHSSGGRRSRAGRAHRTRIAAGASGRSSGRSACPPTASSAPPPRPR